MKATKLPSGSYRCRVTVNGKRVSVTAPSKKEAEKKAIQILANENYIKNNLTLDRAMNEYIKSKEYILAPSTLREYRRCADKDFEDIKYLPIDKITQQIIQNFINNHAKTKSPKFCRNIHGFLSSVLKTYRPDLILNTKLPQKQIHEEYIPTEADIQYLINHITDDDLLNAILLSVFAPARRSEVCALTSDDINNNIVHISKAMVWDGKEWVIKGTKTIAGDRYVEYPSFVIDRIKDRKGRIISCNPNNISNRFRKTLIRLKMPLFRFHVLRHYGCSILHSMGIPDSYIMERGGWESDYTMKAVYRHSLSDEKEKMNEHINNMFSSKFEILATKMDTQN